MEFDFENENEPELPGFETNTKAEESNDPLFNHQSLEESLASLYKPPYPQQRPQESVMPQEPAKPEAPSFPENQLPSLQHHKLKLSTPKKASCSRFFFSPLAPIYSQSVYCYFSSQTTARSPSSGTLRNGSSTA